MCVKQRHPNDEAVYRQAVQTDDGIVGSIFGHSEKDPTKDRGKVLTPEIDRGKDRGKVLTPKIDQKIDRYKVFRTEIGFL